jgi:hypothetical protein
MFTYGFASGRCPKRTDRVEFLAKKVTVDVEY